MNLAGTKSAQRAARVAERKRIRNKSVKSLIKTMLRRAEVTMKQAPHDATDAVKMAIRSLDQAVSKGVLHPNNAARYKSRLMKKLNAALAESQATKAPAIDKKATGK